MDNKLKALQEARNIFENLKTDTKSILFSEENLNMRLLEKLKKSSYSKHKLLLELINLIENDIDQINKTKEEQIPTRLHYVEKRQNDRSALHNFDRPFQLIHADMTSLEFLRKSATIRIYTLLIVDLYSSKVYVYLMHSRKRILQRLEQFYKEIQNKRKNRNMRLQVDNEFQQVKIKDLNTSTM